MNRRDFLQSVSALVLWNPTPKPVIRRFDDGYQITFGILRCLAFDEDAETDLVFSVFLVESLMPGAREENRMLPTELLKQRLESVGYSVMWQQDQWALVARMSSCPSPQDVAARLQLIATGDCKELYS